MTQKQLEMFDIPLIKTQEHSFKPIQYPVWTERKAKLIERYLFYFVLITKHGTYIDGFAGPQKEDEPETWVAHLAIGNEPRWLNNFYLFEQNLKQYDCLIKLKESQPEDSKREIKTFCGDFNCLIHEFLEERPIGKKEATFCLLDQRTFECHWSTVETLATHKDEGLKIELFYFLPISWLDRSITALKDKSVLVNWWGGDDWDKIIGLKPLERALLFCRKFEEELEYKFVKPWPIYSRRGGGRIMYFMIHASDHFEAPKLMYRAYKEVVGDKKPHIQLGFDF